MTGFRPRHRFAPRVVLLLLLAAAHLVSDSVGLAATRSASGKATAARRPGAERPRAIDVKHLALDLHFDRIRRQASGTATITLAPLAPASRVALDAGRLKIESISLADGTPLTFRYDGGDRDDGLVVTLPRRYAAGEDLTLRCAYRTTHVNESDPNNIWGSDGRGLRFFSPTSTEPVKRPQIWSTGWPASNRYWFPGRDAPDDLRTTELSATVELPLTVISNGRLVETRENGDGTRTFRWRMDTPYANHLTSIVAGEFVDVPQSRGGITLHSWGYPDEVDAVRASVVRLPDMFDYFSDITGVPYPFPEYAQVFVQDLPWGWGNAGAATLTENMVDDERTHADWRYLWDGLEAEALAHQWFGALLTPRDWSHAWLDRGFSRCLDGMFNESVNGRDEFLLWQHTGDLGFYLTDWNNGIRHPLVTRDRKRALEFASDNYPPFRGALVLHMLRRHLGEDAWRRALRGYVTAHAGGTVTTDDFARAVESAAGEPMGWFFDQWVYRMGHPVFEVSRRYDGGAGRLTLEVRQTQKLDPKAAWPQTRYFAGAVDVSIDGVIERVRLEPRALNVFTFDRAQEPRLVNFDHEGTWIKEITFEKSTPELLHQLAQDTDILGRRWAMGELVKRAGQEGIPAGDRAGIVAGLRGVIESKAWWRLRMTALNQLRGLLAPAGSTTPVVLDEPTRAMTARLIATERSWVRAAAINLLGTTRDSAHADVYLDAFREESHQVIYAAAAALGRSRSSRAFAALTELMTIPSWKGENRLSGLLGLRELGDPRGIDAAFAAVNDVTSHRWTLATSLWDFRIAGAETLVALGRGADACPVVLERFRKAMAENDVNDIFSNVLLLVTLADARGAEVFPALRERFKDDANAMTAVASWEEQFKAAVAKP